MHIGHLTYRRRTGAAPPGAVVAVVAGLCTLGVGMLVVRGGEVPAAEEGAFRALNDLPDGRYTFAWPFQQLGALLVGPVVALVALALRRYRLALAALIVTAAKLVGERAVKAVVSRERPGTSIGPDVRMRGDVHVAGESFVSGHAVLVAALAGVVTPYLRGRWRLVPWALVGGVMVGRVYVGAHNPLDVVCGAALGIAVAGAVHLATGAARRPVAPRQEVLR
jgi:membrane-associated phospholipid phosphatase